MGWTIGIPSIKLSTTGAKSKHCGNLYLIAAEALQERIGRDPDIQSELSHLNVYYGFRTAKELVDYSNNHVSTLKDAKGRALRSDAVRMCVTLLKPPAAYMARLTRDEQLRLLHDGIKKIKDLVGEKNIKSVAIHFDEQGAHAHIFWEPITPDGRLCAKEMHNLKFFGRLNKELPQHLRNYGWDIDDCNAYDQAQAKLMNEHEKAEQRRKNGRSSAVFKADAERRLNNIDLQIDYTINDLEHRMNNCIQDSIKSVLKEPTGIYDNVLFLMYECDDNRFKELDQEGRNLKESFLEREFKNQTATLEMKPLLNQIRDASTQTIPWETRVKLWEQYRELSECFWSARCNLSATLCDELIYTYENLDDIRQSYYAALGFLHETRDIFSLLIAIMWISSTIIREFNALDELNALKNERRQLVQNTSSFKKYCTVYRDQLKQGKLPVASYLSSMENIILYLDDSYRRIKQLPQFNEAREGLLR